MVFHTHSLSLQPRVVDSGSDSDNSDHIYDVPPNRENILSNLIEEGVSSQRRQSQAEGLWALTVDFDLHTALHESSHQKQHTGISFVREP